MTIRIYFGDQSKITSYSEWRSSAVVATAILAALFQRFPDTIQNIEPSAPPDHVYLKTRMQMPADWVDGTVRL